MKEYIKTMKTSVFSGLFALLLIGGVSSCDLFDHEPDFVSHDLALSFQNASSSDLTKGIGLEFPDNIPEEQVQWGSVKHDLYKLKIVASQPCEDVIAENRKRHPYTPDPPKLYMSKYNGYWFLTNGISFDVNDCPNEKVLTYKLKCPYIFGDEVDHEFVTYWEIPKIRRGITYAKCNRVEFDGKVYTPVKTDDDFHYRVSIILEDEVNP